MRVGYFWASSPDGSDITLPLPGGDFAITSSESFSAIKARLQERLRQQFGDRAAFDLSLNRYSSAMAGTETLDVSITVYLDGAEQGGGYPMPVDSEHDI